MRSGNSTCSLCSPVGALHIAKNEIQKGPANRIRTRKTLMTWLAVSGYNFKWKKERKGMLGKNSLISFQKLY